jgi:hypothetical protein
MTQLDYAQDHLKEIARKSFAAQDKLANLFCEIADITPEQARDLVQFYIRKKLVKLDLTNARYSVNHGAHLDAEFIEYCAAHGAF